MNPQESAALIAASNLVYVGDARFISPAIAETIRDAGNDYLRVVKEHQPTRPEETAGRHRAIGLP
jgi:hypothetical protein